MTTKGYAYVCLMATKYILFIIAKVLKRFYTIIHIVLLLSALAGFSLVGGLLFQLVESPPEQRTIALIMASRSRTLHAMYETFTGDKINKRQEFQVTLGQYEINFIQAIKNGTFFSEGKAVALWTFTGSTYFCVTTFTQLGFGNLAPKSTLGRVITMIYACFSIPVGAVVFADLGRRINILITLAWSFLYNTVRRCREEANKNVDDFGPKTKYHHKRNTNTNYSEEVPGPPTKQLPTFVDGTSATSIPLSEMTSSTKLRINIRQSNSVNMLREAVKYNMVMSFPRMVFGFLILEVTRTVHSYFRRRFQSHSEVCKGKRQRLCSVNFSIHSPGQCNLNSNALEAQSPEADPTIATNQETTAGPQKQFIPRLKQIFGQNTAKPIFKTPRSSVRRSQGRSISDPEAQEVSSLEDIVSLSNEANTEPTSTANLPGKAAWERKSVLAEVEGEEEEDAELGALNFEDRAKIIKEKGASKTYDSVGIIVITALILIIYTVIGAYILTLFEAWNFFIGAWFLFMSIVTVGYGDVTPSSSVFLTYFIPFIIVGMSIFGNLMGLAMLFFNNLTSKFKIIGKSYFDVYSAKTQLSNIEKKSKRARRWWRVLRQHISHGLPRELIDESRQYKLALFGSEREFIKDAFRIYFKKTFEAKLEQQKARYKFMQPSSMRTKPDKQKIKKEVSLPALRPGAQEETPSRQTKSSKLAQARRRMSSAYTRFKVYVSPSLGLKDL